MRAILLVIPAAALSAAAVSLVARFVIPQTCDMGKPAKPVERLGRRAALAMITPVVCWICKKGMTHDRRRAEILEEKRARPADRGA
jgi:hypothetical protein